MIGVIRYAVQEAGVTFFDTAEVYGPYVKWTRLEILSNPYLPTHQPQPL
jgi:aryl-alcohol dehydrogenase-like predicted oxidoreductase